MQIIFMLVYNVISEETPARLANKKYKIVIILTGDKKSFEMNTNIRKNTMLLSSV
jgi:hypothetical protein